MKFVGGFTTAVLMLIIAACASTPMPVEPSFSKLDDKETGDFIAEYGLAGEGLYATGTGLILILQDGSNCAPAPDYMSLQNGMFEIKMKIINYLIACNKDIRNFGWKITGLSSNDLNKVEEVSVLSVAGRKTIPFHDLRINQKF